MIFSVSATFAADEDVALSEVDDVISIEEDALSVEEDTDSLEDVDENVLEESSVVTNDTFHNYFDGAGKILGTVTDDELIFEGDFSTIDVSYIIIDRPIKLTGNNAVFEGVAFTVYETNNVVIDGFNLNSFKDTTNLISVFDSTNVTLSNNILNFQALDDDTVAIYSVAVDNFKVLNNVITYSREGSDAKDNKALVVDTADKKSTNIQVEGNIFNISIPSFEVSYDPYTYNAISHSEGIVFLGCENVTFKRNDISLKYTKVNGSSDTIKVLVIGNSNYEMDYDTYEFTYPNQCKNVVVSDNNITANGHTFVYGISIVAEESEITNNKLDISSDNNYAAGFEIGGPSEGMQISKNTISVNSPLSAYGIYSYQYMGEIKDVSYNENNIACDAYAACGMEIINVCPSISGNTITVTGNHTMGIVGDMIDEPGKITENTVYSLGNNIGNTPTGDGMIHYESTGVCINGDAEIVSNYIESTAIGVDLNKYSSHKGEISLYFNNINVTANGICKNYAICVSGISSVDIEENNITFIGKTDGESIISNAVYISETPTTMKDNNFDLTIPSAAIVYGPAPAYEETILSEGIVIDTVNNLVFSGNDVEVKYGDVLGFYDTIRAVDIINSNDADLSGNTFDIKGHGYAYAIKLSGKDFVIYDNTLFVSSESYTNGINIEGASNGLIDNNVIGLNSKDTAYPIYSGMTGGSPAMIITNNNIYGKAYYVVGIEAAGKGAEIDHNNINVEGNHTIGIGTHLEETIITNNNITSTASNVGDVEIWDGMGTDTTGIKVLTGNATIENNNVQTTGDYAIDLCDNNATLTDNYLASKKAVGKDAVANADNAVITGSGPELKTILSAVDLYTVFDSGDIFYVTAKDENGDPIKNVTIVLNYNDEVLAVNTDENGVAAFYVVDDLDVGVYQVTISYAGNDTYGPKSINALISIEPRSADIVAPTSANVLLTAIKKGSYYNIVLKDDRGNALAGQKVTISFNGKTAVYTTDASGAIKYKLAATKVGTQKLTVKFDSNPNYVASTLTATIKITKEATKLTAAKKTFKAKVKVKKYAVTLKDSKGKAIKKVKLTLKVKGKTYKATTNAKGKATFKIKNLKKKGRYTAKVAFAGNGLYNKVAKSVKITVK